MQSKRILLTRPNHDTTTNYLCEWSMEIIDSAKNRGMRVIDLKGEKANKKDFEQIVKSMQVGLIILNGHGSPNEVCGQGNKTLVKAGENEDSLKSSIVYVRSCETARRLAEKAVKAGAETYIGYENEFVFLTDQNAASRPLSDEIAKPFFEVSNSIPKSLIKGGTVRQAIESSDIQLRKKLDYYKAHYSMEASATMFFLSWNSNCRKVFGNENAEIQ